MTSYIIRRVLLMVPTLVGISFVVFMLLALSPGGIGAGVLAAGGATESQNEMAVRRAKLEDRYGLNEPAVTQYLRWLGRISPVRFGARDLVTPSGEILSRPRPVPEPAAWRWFVPSLPAPAGTDESALRSLLPAGETPEARAARVAAFRPIERAYVEARANYTAADARARDAIRRYLEETMGRDERARYMSKDKVFASRLDGLTPRRDARAFAEVERLVNTAVGRWGEAVAARERMVSAMSLRPYPAAGMPLVPGVVSLAWPDLGVSFSRNKPVADLIATHLPVTLLLNVLAFPIIYLVAVPSGMLAAVKRGTWADVGLGGVYVALYSIPAVLAGVLLLGFVATPEYLGWFPTSGLNSKEAEGFAFLPGPAGAGEGGEAVGWSRGWLLDTLWHVCLPVLCLVYTGFAVLSKQTRAAMLENLSADYVRTAKAKGVAGRDVILVHVLRNSLLPLITIFVTIFPAMLAGAVVIERVFSVPGMGTLLLDAISQRDRELILANTTIIAVVNLLALLLADILYALADPRITYK